MAGVKGRSGGARPGAGRKKNVENEGAEYTPDTTGATPLEVLQKMMNDPEVPIVQRIKAAAAAAPYLHQKLGEGGKKDQQQDAAKKVASRFAPSAPPKLVAAGGRKV